MDSAGFLQLFLKKQSYHSDYALKIINNGLLSGQKARQFYTHKKRGFFIQERVLFVYFCLHLFGYITAMRKEVDKYGRSMGQNHLLIDFVKKTNFPT